MKKVLFILCTTSGMAMGWQEESMVRCIDQCPPSLEEEVKNRNYNFRPKPKHELDSLSPEDRAVYEAEEKVRQGYFKQAALRSNCIINCVGGALLRPKLK